MFDKLLTFLGFGKGTPPPPVEDNEPVFDPITGSRGTRPTPWLLSLLAEHRNHCLQRWLVEPQQLVLPPDSLGPEPEDEEDLELVVAWMNDFRRRAWGQ
ncbi:hypothetical protein CCMA1212_009489 [Trichoderma ghanense]|uniref:Uncharacterized protein n=1 Tax=Trichoderma ghanense TaxID=65468 RepID=A0ABY2GT21_9HYPO